MRKDILKVSITGIDGSGKTSSINEVIGRLNGLNIALRDVPVDYRNKSFFTYVEQRLETVWLWAEKHNNKFIPGIGYVLTTMLYKPTSFLRYTFNGRPDILVNHRDPIIDSAVYFSFYWRWINKVLRLPPQAKIEWARRIIMEDLPDVVIHLEVDPSLAIARIIEKLKKSDKKSVLHLHEAKVILTELQNSYREVIEQAKQEKSSMKIFRLDTGQTSQEEIGLEISKIIMSCLKSCLM